MSTITVNVGDAVVVVEDDSTDAADDLHLVGKVTGVRDQGEYPECVRVSAGGREWWVRPVAIVEVNGRPV